MTEQNAGTMAPPDEHDIDVCVVSDAPGELSDLQCFLKSAGCRAIVTTPARLPEELDWEAYDLVLLDWKAEVGFPEVPLKRINFALGICSKDEIDNPQILRAALKAGARDLLPRLPGTPRWENLLQTARTTPPKVAIRFLDSRSQLERFFRIERDKCTIGRDPTCDVVFSEKFVSRTHARIERCGRRQYRIVDAGSRAGTFVNGNRVTEHTLSEGDRIHLGGQRGPLVTFTTATISDGTFRLDNDGFFEKHAVNREVHDIAALLESFLSLNSDLLLEEVLELLLDRLVAFVGAERGVILLRPWRANTSGKLSVNAVTLGICRDKTGRSIPEENLDINYRIVSETLRLRRGCVDEEPLPPDPGAPGEAVERVRSCMCVPLKVRGKLFGDGDGPTIIGMVYVDSVTRGRPFSPRAVNTLEVLAAEAAMAVHTALLYEDSLRQKRVREEMDIAREIQKNIFEEQCYEGVNWQCHGTTTPSLEVGGDFLSCYPISPDRISIIIGDVSGKGVPAALFSTMIDGLFHGMADFRGESPDLGEAAGKLNRFVLAKSRLAKFVTAIFGVLEPDGTFSYVNSGHNPALVLRGNGNLEELPSSGTILGMFENAEFNAHRVALQPEDVVLLYSDGIVDSRNSENEPFGVENLYELVKNLHAERSIVGDPPASWFHSEILKRLKQYWGGTPPRDDVTLLVIRRGTRE